MHGQTFHAQARITPLPGWRARLRLWLFHFAGPLALTGLLTAFMVDGDVATNVIFLTMGVGYLFYIAPYLFVAVAGAAVLGAALDLRRGHAVMLAWFAGPCLGFFALPALAQLTATHLAAKVPTEQTLSAPVDLRRVVLNFEDYNAGSSRLRCDRLCQSLLATDRVEAVFVTSGGNVERGQLFRKMNSDDCAARSSKPCIARTDDLLFGAPILHVRNRPVGRSLPDIVRQLTRIDRDMTVRLEDGQGRVLARAGVLQQAPLAFPLHFRFDGAGNPYGMEDFVPARMMRLQGRADLVDGVVGFLAPGLNAMPTTPPPGHLVRRDDYAIGALRRDIDQELAHLALTEDANFRAARVDEDAFIRIAKGKDWPEADLDRLAGLIAARAQNCEILDAPGMIDLVFDRQSEPLALSLYGCISDQIVDSSIPDDRYTAQLRRLSPAAKDWAARMERVALTDRTDNYPLVLWERAFASRTDMRAIWQRQLAGGGFPPMVALDRICQAPPHHRETGLQVMEDMLANARWRKKISARMLAILAQYGRADAHLKRVPKGQAYLVDNYMSATPDPETGCPPWGDPPY